MGQPGGGTGNFYINWAAGGAEYRAGNGLKYSDRYRGNPVGFACAGYRGLLGNTQSNLIAFDNGGSGGGGGAYGTGPNHPTSPNVGPGYWHNGSTTALHLDSSAKAYSYDAAAALSNGTKTTFLGLWRK